MLPSQIFCTSVLNNEVYLKCFTLEREGAQDTAEHIVGPWTDSITTKTRSAFDTDPRKPAGNHIGVKRQNAGHRSSCLQPARSPPVYSAKDSEHIVPSTQANCERAFPLKMLLQSTVSTYWFHCFWNNDDLLVNSPQDMSPGTCQASVALLGQRMAS